MLRRRLTLLAAALLTTAACSEGGAIEEGVVRPGITAITDDAPAATCAANAATLRSAIESYTLIEGSPPLGEATLVEAGYLRAETSDWDVVDGRLIPENPACEPVADGPIATLDIVTEPAPVDPETIYESFDPAAIVSIGGEDCARDLATIIAAAESFVAERGADPADIDELVSTGYLSQTPERWELRDAELVPVEGSGCNVLE